MYKGSLVKIRHQSIHDLGRLAEFQNSVRYMETHGHNDPRFVSKEALEKKYKERMEKHNHNELHLVIETVEGKVIGGIGIDGNFWKNGLTFLYSYMGDDEYLQGGYYEEAVELMLEFLFVEGNARKVKISLQSNDAYSVAAYQAKGFQIEVTAKGDVLSHGKYIDVYEMAIFKEDYMKTYKK